MRFCESYNKRRNSGAPQPIQHPTLTPWHGLYETSLLYFSKRSLITSQLILGNCQDSFVNCSQTPEGQNGDRTNYRAACPWSNQNYYKKTSHSPVYYSVCLFTEESGSCCVRVWEWDVINCFQKFSSMRSGSSTQHLSMFVECVAGGKSNCVRNVVVKGQQIDILNEFLL